MNASSQGPLTIRTLRALDELAGVRVPWGALQAHPWSDLDYYREFLARQEGFLRPHVLLVERGGVPVTLVVASLRRERLAWKVGSFTLARSRATVLWIGTGGVLGEDSPEVAAALCQELLAALARGEAALVHAHQLECDSSLAHALAAAPALARDRWARPSPGWVLELPESYEAYLASRSKSVRRHLKRYANALERELAGALEVVTYRAPEELERLVGDSEAVARLTYHRGLRVGFADTPEVRRFFAFALAAGWMRGTLLYAHGKPIAFWHGLVYRGTFVTRDTGYDPAMAALRPGQYLLDKVIAEHCRLGDVRCLDYGVMELDYKRNFGTRRYQRVSPYLFSRRPSGLWLFTLRTLSGALDRLARRVLGSRARELARRLARLGRGGKDESGAREDVESKA